MVFPTPREKHIPSKDILRCAAQSLQPTGVGGGHDGAGGNNRQGTIHHVVRKVWGAVGLVMENSLILAARGVRIESVGTFTLDAKGCAGFFLADDFARRFRLLKYDVCSGGCLAGGAVNTRLNIAKVAATAGIPRPEVERVVDAVLRALQQRLASGSSVALCFHPVAEFSCTPSGQATMRFLRSFRAKEKKAIMKATHTRVGVARTKPTPNPRVTASDAAVAIATVSGIAGSTTASRSKVIGRRPHSASSASMHRSTFDRPKASHFLDARKCSPVASTSDQGNSTLRNTSLVTSNVGRTTAKGGQTGEALETPPPRIDRNISRRGTSTLSSSCVSSRFSPDAPLAGRGKSASSHGIGNALDRCSHDDDELLTIAQEEMGFEKSGLGTVRNNRESRVASPTSTHQSDLDQENREKLLSGLLRRQTLAQAGDEGLRRLVETLRLTHVANERGGGARLSGRDLLVALRDVGTKLTSTELAYTTSVFRQELDGRISLPVFLAGMAIEEVTRPSSTSAREKRVGPASAMSIAAVARRGFSGLPWESSSCQGGPAQAPSPNVSLKGVKSALSSPRLSESSTVNIILRRGRLGEEQAPGRDNRCGGDQQQSGGEHKANGSGREQESSPRVLVEQAAVATGSATSQNARRECWTVDKDARGGPHAANGSAVAEDAIADLAKIVYNPPASLEKLIHVLQASKVNENPTMSCATLAACLVRMQRGLGKTRAMQLAAAACRYPEKQVDLAQLHAVLERRFGRCGGGSLGSGGKTYSSSTTMATIPSSFSCAAVERVRRKLLTNKKRGLAALRAALNSVGGGGGSGEAGSLTKDQLRRAITLAGGKGSLPPSTKDVDDLFTLFSSRTLGSVGGGLVDAATVLRGLRGELSPFREKVLRDVFHASSLRPTSRNNNCNTRSSSSSSGSKHGRANIKNDFGDTRSDGVICGGDEAGGSHTPRAQLGSNPVVTNGDTSHIQEPTRNANHRSGGGGGGGERGGICSGKKDNGTNPRSGNTVGGNRPGLGGWCSSAELGLGGGDTAPRVLLAASNVDKRNATRRRTPAKGVSIEQFFEYYRDVSATIDGDDAFEAKVRASWPPRRAFPHSEEGGGGAASEEVDQQVAAARVGGGGCSRSTGVALPSQRQGEGPAANRDGRALAGTGRGSVPAEGSQQRHQQQLRGRAKHEDEKGGCGGNGGSLPSRGRTEEESSCKSTSAREGATAYAGASAAAAAVARSARQNTMIGSPDKKGGRSGRSAGMTGRGAVGGRQAAATHVQSLFRGHRGRTYAAAESRKRARRLAAEKEEREEQQRPRAGGRLSRPKGRSTYGF